MHRPRTVLALAFVATILLGSSTALADLVLLLPARGQVPGSMLSSILERETRYAIVELGHKVVEPAETEAAMRGRAADNADDYAAMARVTRADWVIAPAVNPIDHGYHLDLTAYQAKGGRVESVSRDIDTERVHDQTVEMLRVLLRPEGVGTGALPWETGGVRPPLAAGTQAAGSSTTTVTASGPATAGDAAHTWFFVGAGIGASTALKRPADAVGSSTSFVGALRAGISPSDSLDLAVNFAANLSGPSAKMLDGSVRYLFMAAPSIRLGIGPEAGVGVFISGSGSQSNSFMARLALVTGARVARAVTVEASLGDLRIVPASSGTLVVGGASLHGVLRF